jgi:preprotein translocase subunit SecE
MPPEDELDREDDAPQEAPEESGAESAQREPEGGPSAEDADQPREVHDVAPVGVASPSQLGAKRFVYAAYFGGAIAIAFLSSKIVDFAWYKLQSYKPSLPEPKDEYVMPLAALVGLAVAVYCWYRTRTRQLAEEVAAEMAKVTWPSRTEVTNGTFVVIVTTVVSTAFFALMDKFWGFLTNLVYGS